MNPVDIIEGYKTYIAAIGLVGLSLYQLSQNDLASAVQSFMGALAAFGVRHAIARSERAAVARHDSMMKHLHH